MRCGHHGDDTARRAIQVLDRGALGRIVHADRQRLAGRRNRDDGVSSSVVAVDDLAQPSIERHSLEVEVWNLQLNRQRLAHAGVVDIAKFDQHLTERPMRLLLRRERVLELLRRDGAVSDEDVAQPRPLPEGVKNGVELTLGQDFLAHENLAQGDPLSLQPLACQRIDQLDLGHEAFLHQQFA